MTRHASSGARRTWFRPAPGRLQGATAGPDAAPAHRRPGSKQVARIAAAIVAIAALAAAGAAGRAAVAASFTVLGHLHWLWIPAAVLLESASMAAFAVMLRRLLAAGGASIGIRPMLATAYAGAAGREQLALHDREGGHGHRFKPDGGRDPQPVQMGKHRKRRR